MNKHTEGPWAFDEFAGKIYITPESDGCKYITESPAPHYDADSTQYSAEEWRANARLIAAAPDMLEALDEADTALAVFNLCGDCPQTRSAVKRAWAMVNAAMAKAKGTVDHFAEANA